ncbi:GEM-like protein 1 [Gastrolobium bilobum]|uniref:GEM-like protein 1 n=1 Tax=Gastrolobium bilobum TaxID=150636 RepID=UPI002AB13EE7|nr:GEM-like protein 1 [Gastrolobium bilobum]
MNDHREIPVTATSTGMSNYGSNNPYVHISPLPTSSTATNRPNPMDTVYDALNRCSRKVEEATRRAEIMADNFWNHIRISSNLADATIARIVQGTKVLTLGGPDMLFQQTFGIFQEEKLLKPFACYISTSTGPVIGTLYVSTKRLAFCSDYPLCHYPFSQQNHTVNYKVVVQLDQLSTVCPSTNRLNPAEKYIQLVTVDGYEFFFMGFVAYEKALKTIKEALQQYRNHYRGGLSVQQA